ncbi:hypothetical protein M747DRAFT_319299 [Aspergillus niger ATCC 13496]|uniref:Contig An10c0050, genomic contig n=3 Tax=Aspergillus niger TaxID=5061 RepID=A2QV42_ASPNC|nr:uncharacterized protein An10g00930 [Aspergillus niger]RDH14681.1 hypothetical protein M747DRAFT_319299 [Aspergillus niger ATCC 13496]CAK40529.1 unnamed protein product [Aspergillus niger]
MKVISQVQALYVRNSAICTQEIAHTPYRRDPSCVPVAAHGCIGGNDCISTDGSLAPALFFQCGHTFSQPEISTRGVVATTFRLVIVAHHALGCMLAIWGAKKGPKDFFDRFRREKCFVSDAGHRCADKGAS